MKQYEIVGKLIKNNKRTRYIYLRDHPLLEPLRNDPKFQELLEINRIKHQIFCYKHIF